MYENLYCKVYIHSKLGIEELYQLVNNMVFGTLEPMRSIKTDWGEIDLRRNQEFDPEHLNDFIYWPYYLDMEPLQGIAQDIYIGKVRELLKEMEIHRITAVAACDFECLDSSSKK